MGEIILLPVEWRLSACVWIPRKRNLWPVPSRYPNPTRYLVLLSIPDPTRFSFGNYWVAGTRNIGYYPMFRVNPKFRVLPDISGITHKRKTIPSSGAPLWDPQKGPQGAKKCKICHFDVKYDCGTPFGWTIIVQDLWPIITIPSHPSFPSDT